MTLTANECRHFDAAGLCPVCGYRNRAAPFLLFRAADLGLWKTRFRWPKRRTYGWRCPECDTSVIAHQEVSRTVTCP